MKTKLTAILLFVLMGISFGACAGKDKTAGGKDKTPDQTVVMTDENGETETVAQGQPATQTVPEIPNTDAPTSDKNGSTVVRAPDAPSAASTKGIEDAPPQEEVQAGSADNKTVAGFAPAEKETPIEKFNSALLETFTEEQKSSQWFSAYGTPSGNNGTDAVLTMEQYSADTTAAFHLAAGYYASAKKAAQSAGLSLTSYEFTVLCNGITVGTYKTTDGKTYTATMNGESATLTAQPPAD